MNEAFDPRHAYAFLEDGGGIIPFPDTSSFWSQLMSGSYTDESLHAVAAAGGWLLTANDLIEDMRHWEMHPDGNEVLVVLDGAMDVVVEEPAGDRTFTVGRGEACVVPQGAWHRQVVRERGRILAITFGRGTQHRPR